MSAIMMDAPTNQRKEVCVPDIQRTPPRHVIVMDVQTMLSVENFVGRLVYVRFAIKMDAQEMPSEEEFDKHGAKVQYNFRDDSADEVTGGGVWC